MLQLFSWRSLQTPLKQRSCYFPMIDPKAFHWGCDQIFTNTDSIWWKEALKHMEKTCSALLPISLRVPDVVQLCTWSFSRFIFWKDWWSSNLSSCFPWFLRYLTGNRLKTLEVGVFSGLTTLDTLWVICCWNGHGKHFVHFHSSLVSFKVFKSNKSKKARKKTQLPQYGHGSLLVSIITCRHFVLPILLSRASDKFTSFAFQNLSDDFWVRAYRFDFASRGRPRVWSMSAVGFLTFIFRGFGRAV